MAIITPVVEHDLEKPRKRTAISLFETQYNMAEKRTERWQQWVPQLAEAGLAGDQRRLELLVVTLIRSLRTEAPDLSSELGTLLAQYSTNPGGLRWKSAGPPPTDPDEGFALVRLVELDTAPEPILPEEVFERIKRFIQERNDSDRLLKEGFTPPCSVLLTGAPGTGKSMLAHWLAHELRLPLVMQDLATSISSFLGKTGFNLRRTLDYARSQPCVLLLDEFDAIAKRRDDSTEVGELKRIVNVLLKELEDWPLHSVLVAATNHPDLLDPAIRRRFHLVLNLPLPGENERQSILRRAGGRFSDEITARLLSACAATLEGCSGSDLQTLMHAAVRRHLASGTSLVKSLLGEVHLHYDCNLDSKVVGPLVRALQNASQEQFTVRELAEVFGKSTSTIQHHLKKEAVDG
ncbi:MAG TPA: AAA family ATPase [Pirellulales bacterium]|jgi:hypothetical protein